MNDPTLEAVRARTQKVFRAGGGSRPEVRLVEHDGRLAVLKDYTHSDPLFHRLLGPMSVRREARALRLLDGVTGIPRLLATFGKDAVLLEYVDGASARDLKAGAFSAEFFERL